ncbi:MAG: hypothetical protein ACPGQL_08800 [Thermoplasmatota archaeon]
MEPIEPGQNVLFLCWGNICRSPFAHRYAARAWPDVTVGGGGTYPQEGRRTPREGQAAARAGWGIDLGDHGSHIVTAAEMAVADHVFVFDAKNVGDLGALFPDDAHKLRLLGPFDPADPDPTITDPYGGGVETFHHCYTRTARAIDALRPAQGAASGEAG